MGRRKFNSGLLAGVILTIAVMVLIGVLTLQANAAMRTTSDSDSSTSFNNRMPQLGEVTFKGIIEEMLGDSYVISGLTFRFDMQTMITPGLAVGDAVKVKALLLPDQTRYALSIQRDYSGSSDSDPKFEFYGIVESAGSPSWLVSGEAVQVDESTLIETGVDIGSLVEVEGRIVRSSLLARDIHLEDRNEKDEDDRFEEKTSEDNNHDDFELKEGKLEFTGVVQSISGDLWVIDGYRIAVGPETEVKGNPQPGDLVKVEAFLQFDGINYLADEIEAEGDDSDEGKDEKEKRNDDRDDDWDNDRNDHRDDDFDDDKDDDRDENRDNTDHGKAD